METKTKEQWMMYCWMRGFEYEQTVSVTFTHTQEMVSKEEFDNFAVFQQKEMDDFFASMSDRSVKELGEQLFGKEF